MKIDRIIKKLYIKFFGLIAELEKRSALHLTGVWNIVYRLLLDESKTSKSCVFSNVKCTLIQTWTLMFKHVKDKRIHSQHRVFSLFLILAFSWKYICSLFILRRRNSKHIQHSLRPRASWLSTSSSPRMTLSSGPVPHHDPHVVTGDDDHGVGDDTSL